MAGECNDGICNCIGFIGDNCEQCNGDYFCSGRGNCTNNDGVPSNCSCNEGYYRNDCSEGECKVFGPQTIFEDNFDYYLGSGYWSTSDGIISPFCGRQSFYFNYILIRRLSSFYHNIPSGNVNVKKLKISFIAGSCYSIDYDNRVRLQVFESNYGTTEIDSFNGSLNHGFHSYEYEHELHDISNSFYVEFYQKGTQCSNCDQWGIDYFKLSYYLDSTIARGGCNTEHGGGFCVDTLKCECNKDFYGDQCDITKCGNYYSNNTDNVCNGHGDCINEMCECYSSRGYFGTYCENQICDVNGDCRGRAEYCEYSPSQNDNTCFNCDTGYSGKYCQIPYCKSDCNYAGTCIYPYKCACYFGREGELCERVARSCYGVLYNDEPEFVCSGHGQCIAQDFCKCNPGWEKLKWCNSSNVGEIIFFALFIPVTTLYAAVVLIFIVVIVIIIVVILIIRKRKKGKKIMIEKEGEVELEVNKEEKKNSENNKLDNSKLKENGEKHDKKNDLKNSKLTQKKEKEDHAIELEKEKGINELPKLPEKGEIYDEKYVLKISPEELPLTSAHIVKTENCPENDLKNVKLQNLKNEKMLEKKEEAELPVLPEKGEIFDEKYVLGILWGSSEDNSMAQNSLSSVILNAKANPK